MLLSSRGPDWPLTVAPEISKKSRMGGSLVPQVLANPDRNGTFTHYHAGQGAILTVAPEIFPK